jgi:hypothetical protein
MGRDQHLLGHETESSNSIGTGLSCSVGTFATVPSRWLRVELGLGVCCEFCQNIADRWSPVEFSTGAGGSEALI